MKSHFFAALALIAAAGCAAETGTEDLGKVDQGLDGTYWYFRSNASGWDANDATRLRPSAPYMQTLYVDVTQDWMVSGGDSSVFTQTNALNGWGTSSTDYGVVHSSTVVVPGGDQLRPGGNFTVKYPALGRYSITLNDQMGSFLVDRASASKTWEPEPNARMTSIARGYGIGCDAVTAGPKSAVVGYDNGHLYRKADASNASEPWQRLDLWTDASGGKHAMPGSAVLSIAVNPCNDREVLVSYAGSKQGTKLFKTGTLATWVQITTIPLAEVWSLSYDPTTTGHVFAIGDGGRIAESSDYGNTFTSDVQATLLAPPLSGERISTVSRLYDDRKSAVVGTTAGHLFLSFDVTQAPQSWTPLGTRDGLPATAVTKITVNPKLNPPEIYATFTGMRNAVWRSANGGQSFVNIQNSALPANDWPAGIYGFSGISLVPGSEQVLVIGSVGIYGVGRSEDRGQTWTFGSTN